MQPSVGPLSVVGQVFALPDFEDEVGAWRVGACGDPTGAVEIGVVFYTLVEFGFFLSAGVVEFGGGPC